MTMTSARLSPASKRHAGSRMASGMRRACLACGIWLAAAQALAQPVPGCGDLRNSFGPWDFRKDRGEPLTLVESAHFTPEVEMLIRGKSTTVIGQDLDYTLRAFPNHHRALVSTARLADRQKTDKPAGMQHTVDCWFRRAVQWKSDDHVARMLYAQWLAQKGRRDDARAQLQAVDALVADNAIARFNLGLLYLELQDYDAALAQAHRAHALGFTRPELRERLQQAGKWADPPTPAAPAAASSPTSASGG
jgi:hypothetical protein